MRRVSLRYLALAVVLAMLGFVWVGVLSVRRDAALLRSMTQDTVIWTANQVENELMRLRLSLAMFVHDPTPGALERVRQRYEILLSRSAVQENGALGRALRQFDASGGAMQRIESLLQRLEPEFMALEPGDAERASRLLAQLERQQRDARLFTLAVVRGQSSRAAELRDRVLTRGQITAGISFAAVLVSLLALLLILRENRRQYQIAELNRQSAELAELSSRAKSRFLTMMSHELRNPLHGVLGALALLRAQPGLTPPQQELVERAKHSGEAVVQMLSGLLDYGEIQDGRLKVKVEPLPLAFLAESVAEALRETGAGHVCVTVAPQASRVVLGDGARIRQIFVALAEYLRESAVPRELALTFSHAERNLIGELRFADPARAGSWRAYLETAWSPGAPDQVPSEALRPIIVQALVAALGGALEVGDDRVRVRLPAPRAPEGRRRVHLETRSAALAAIYRSALRCDPIDFVERGAVDVVLVDAAGLGETLRMRCLRERFPGARLVALGIPEAPELFDKILAAPVSIDDLRRAVLGGR